MVSDVLKEIDGYNINKDNCDEFFFQSKGRGDDDFAFFFYKSSLLQLMQCTEHLDKMIAFYYGIDDIDVHSISDDISNIYKEFIQGNNEELYKVLNLAVYWEEEFDKLYDVNRYGFINFNVEVPEEIKKIKEKICELDLLIQLKYNDLDSLAIKKDNLKIMEEELGVLSIIKLKGLIKRRRQYKDKLNKKEECSNKIADLEMAINDKDKEIKLKVMELESIFRENGAVNLLEKINFSEAISEDNDSFLQNDIKFYASRFYKRFTSYMNFVMRYHRLLDDIYLNTKVVQGYSKIINEIDNGIEFSDLCLMIRNLLFGENELVLRDVNLVANSKFMSNTSKSTEVKGDFDKLCNLFKDILKEQDADLFIRKCADFHLELLRVHPFYDGNGRTSRVLLVTMLMSHNIMLPTLYYESYAKGEFYNKHTDEVLEGDYRNVEQNLYHILGRYYPNILPLVPEEKRTIDTSVFHSSKR